MAIKKLSPATLELIAVDLAVKQARHKKLSNYILNQNLQIEARILQDEIDALKDILNTGNVFMPDRK